MKEKKHSMFSRANQKPKESKVTIFQHNQNINQILRTNMLGTPALLSSVLSLVEDCKKAVSISNNLLTSLLHLIYENILGQFFLSDLHMKGYHSELRSRKQ